MAAFKNQYTPAVGPIADIIIRKKLAQIGCELTHIPIHKLEQLVDLLAADISESHKMEIRTSDFNIHNGYMSQETTAAYKGDATNGLKIKVSWMNSVQTIFATILILLTSVIIGSYLLYNYYSAQKAIQSDLDSLAEDAAERISKYLIEPVWGIEEEQIGDALSLEMMDRNIQAITVHDRDTQGTLLRKVRRLQSGESELPIDGLLFKRRPIIRKGEVTGDLEVVVTPRYLQKSLNRETTRLSIYDGPHPLIEPEANPGTIHLLLIGETPRKDGKWGFLTPTRPIYFIRSFKNPGFQWVRFDFALHNVLAKTLMPTTCSSS